MHCRSEKATWRTNIGIGEMHDNTIGDHIGATHRLYATGNLWARIRFIFAVHDFKCKLQKQHTFRQLCNSFVVLINLVSAKQDELHTKLNGDFALKMLCYCCFICLYFLIRLGFFFSVFVLWFWFCAFDCVFGGFAHRTLHWWTSYQLKKQSSTLDGYMGCMTNGFEGASKYWQTYWNCQIAIDWWKIWAEDKRDVSHSRAP